MNEIIEWLESPDGLAWSRDHHRRLNTLVIAWIKEQYDDDWGCSARWPDTDLWDDLD